jgi:hypothetical protein
MHALATLLGSLRRCLEGFPDKRHGLNVMYPMADIGMAAFSVFFMQSPSFLSHQRRLEAGHGRSNCESLFGLSKIPSDNHIRDMLDAATPELLNPMFAETVETLRRREGGLDDFRRLGDRLLIALDGTEYHCSKSIHCRHCSHRLRGATKRKPGETEYFHTMLAASLVAPGHDKVIPLEPEFIVPQDGAEKQDCENAAAKRWLAAHGRRYAELGAVFLGDDLFSRQPLCEAVGEVGGSFIFVCKPASHVLIQEYVTGVELPTLDVPVRRGKQRYTHRHRWLAEVPLRDGKDALTVNWLEIEILNAKGHITYRNSFVTDLAVGPDTVVELAAAGRARWKIENETFNVLKNKGYNLEHSFGHGKQHLASILVSLNLLAFAMHTVCDIADQLWQKARQKLGPRYNFFSMLSSATALLIFPSWPDLLQTLAFDKPAPAPP